MRPMKVKKSITLDQDLIDIIEDLSQKEDRSFSQYVNLVLRLHTHSQNTSGNTGTYLTSTGK